MYLKKLRLIELLVILGLVFSTGAAYACHPYPDSKLADVYSYQATLTFEVKP